MLKRLSIKNMTLIRELTLELGHGLNIITGETGAGKSIIINTLQLLLGSRAEIGLVRPGTDFALVEAEFEPTRRVRELLQEEGLVGDFQLLSLTRQVNRNGRNRILCNDQPVTLQFLKTLGAELLDIHGQHQHQSLLDETTHLAPFDYQAPYQDLLNQFQSLFIEYQQLFRSWEKNRKHAEQMAEKLAFYQFQYNELAKFDFHEDEDRELEEEIRILANTEKLVTNGQWVADMLYEGDNAIINQFEVMMRKIEEASEIDSSLKPTLDSFENLQIITKELGEFFLDYWRKIQADPARLNQLEKRLADLQKLTLKYRKSLNELILYRNELQDNITNFSHSDESLRRQSDELHRLERELIGIGRQLSIARQSQAIPFQQTVETILRRLGMQAAAFKIEFFPPESGIQALTEDLLLTPTGLESLRFLIAPNPGTPFAPLSRIASGGEISRIMLALKSVMADSSTVSTLIFDEIDTGVSGRIAEMTGLEMKKLSEVKQIICITHLHQIAALGSLHFSVRKYIENGETFTTILPLNENDRIDELARIIGGETPTDSARDHARAILGR